VLEARNGEEALEQVARAAGKLDLLVTDLVMPRIGGRQLAAKLRDAVPRLRVLFLSGYTEDLSLAHELAPADAFLHKPFTPVALANKVRSVLDAESQALDGVAHRHDTADEFVSQRDARPAQDGAVIPLRRVRPADRRTDHLQHDLVAPR